MSSEPIELLRQTLAERCHRNPKYSMRRFAQHMGLHPSVLSLVLSGKRKLSKRSALKVAQALDLSPETANHFLASCGFKKLTSMPASDTLRLDQFEFIAGWQHYAVLSLLKLPGTKSSSAWMAKRLGLSTYEVEVAVNRLLRLKLIRKTSTGRLKRVAKPIVMGNTSSSSGTRKHHRELLTKAIESLETVPFELRDFSCTTFAMDKRLVAHALERIRAFRRQLVQELEARSQNADAVYEISVQLFPLTIERGLP